MSERNDIFLHFLKPDNLELYAQKYGYKKVTSYFYDCGLIEETFRFAILLTKNYCLIPPAFIIESKDNFRLIKKYSELLNESLLKFVIREDLFELYAAKKICEYFGHKKLNPRFQNYNSTTFQEISNNLNLQFLQKNLEIGSTSAKLWNQQINNLENGEFYFLKDIYDKDKYYGKKIIKTLNFDIEELTGKAFVWEFIEEKLSNINISDTQLKFNIHSVLQNYYIRSNIKMDNWALISSSPLFGEVDFNIKSSSLKYDYRAFAMFLDYLNIRQTINNISVSEFIRIRNSLEYNYFIELFDKLAIISENNLDKFKVNYQSIHEIRNSRISHLCAILRFIFLKDYLNLKNNSLSFKNKIEIAKIKIDSFIEQINKSEILYDNKIGSTLIHNNTMTQKEKISELIFDEFRKTNCRAGHIVMMRVFRFSLLPKLNPKEQDLFIEVVNDLISNGYIEYEKSSPECLRLTKKGYVHIYTPQNSSDVKESIYEKRLPIVVILTAIQEEYNAVRLHLKDICDADQNDTNYEKGIFEFNGNEIAQVIIRECGSKNAIASQETERAIFNFKPNCMLFVGIAGSRKPNDFGLGDVVFPEKIYSYEGGRSEKDSFKPRPDLVAPTFALMEHAKSERRKNDWKTLIKNDWDKIVKANLGVIASGEQLVEHYDSEIGRILTDHFNDTSAVEMEGFGFAKAATRQGRETNNILIGVVRGISDIIEKSNSTAEELVEDRRPDNVKQFASDTAAAFAFWLMYKLYK